MQYKNELDSLSRKYASTVSTIKFLTTPIFFVLYCDLSFILTVLQNHGILFEQKNISPLCIASPAAGDQLPNFITFSFHR